MKFQETLFYIRVAASEWLAEHHDSPNAENVKAALLATNPPGPPWGMKPGAEE